MPARSRALSVGLTRGGLLGGVGALLVGLALSACASKDRPSALVEPTDASAAPAAESAPLLDLAEEQDGDGLGDDYDDATAKDAAREVREGEAELDLAAYERLLVEQELRLRSAGVALRGDQVAATSEGAGYGKGNIGGATAEPPRSAPVGKTATEQGKRPKKKSSGTSSKPSVSGGGSAPGAGRAAPSRISDEADRCITICDLAKTTCELEQRICDLASRHPDEERYSQVCERASDDCELARSACESCLV